jgi:hypothetical protein
MTKRLLLAGALALAVPDGAHAAEIDETIQTCVLAVHFTRGAPIDEEGYTRFDAYFEPRTETVRTFGTLRAYWLFSKCMAKLGEPLGPERRSHR